MEEIYHTFISEKMDAVCTIIHWFNPELLFELQAQLRFDFLYLSYLYRKTVNAG